MRMHGEMTGGMGPIGGMGPMGGSMMQMLDAGDDGSLTPEEAREQLQAKLVEYDADGNGTLSIAEFETLHSAMIRETMVDRFQSLDADGDGAVTKDEMSAPAEFMERMQQIRSQMNAGPQGQQQMGQGMDGNSMMKDN
jgi:Ca2+-binding EF-hand superfamily protein